MRSSTPYVIPADAVPPWLWAALTKVAATPAMSHMGPPLPWAQPARLDREHRRNPTQSLPWSAFEGPLAGCLVPVGDSARDASPAQLSAGDLVVSRTPTGSGG